MIKLTERLSVTADKYQYIVGTPKERRRNAGEGTETVMVDPKYCRTLAQALRVAIGLEMRRGVESGELTTLADFAKRLEMVTEDFESKLSVFNI